MSILDSEFRIGIDLGGTKTEIAGLKAGDLVDRFRKPTPAAEGYRAIVDTIVSMIEEFRQMHPDFQKSSVGVGIPGIVDQNTGLVMNANTTVMIGHPLRDDLSLRLEQTVQIENDANCFALAEAKSGAGKNYDNIFGVIMGTGCGGGMVIDRKIYSGSHGIAGEWGHFSIDPNGPLCWCGNNGCIETFISGTALEERYYHALKGTDFREKRIPKDELTFRAPDIIQKMRQSESIAQSVFNEFIEDFARALGGLISVFDPGAVILGGGLSNIDELYTKGKERVNHYAFHRNLTTPILKNELGDSAGVFGAAWLGST